MIQPCPGNERSPPSSFLTKRSTPSGGFLKEKEYSFLTKRSTPFGQFVEQKEYSFCSIFGAKGVLVWNFWIFFFFKLALLLLWKSGKRSTPFGPFLYEKEYCFFPIIGPKGVYIKCISIFISVVCGAILTCETIFCIYRISGIQFWHQRAQQNAALCFKTLFKTWSVSLLSVVQSRLVIPFFASTKSQEFNYGISARNRTRHCALRHFLRPDPYLWCPWSNLDIWNHFLHLQNLRNSIMASVCTTKRGIVL